MPRSRRKGKRRSRNKSTVLRRKQQGIPSVTGNDVKVAFGLIVFNAEYVLQAVLESVYPFAEQIVVAEGPVSYFVSQGYTSSSDRTVEIVETFPDPHNKIELVRGQWSEKDEMVNAYAKLIRDDIDYVWHVDGDEVYKVEDVKAVFRLLPGYDSVGFRSLTFYGGFTHVLTGFEQNAEFHRIQRWYEGARWQTHRPPTIVSPESGRPWREHRHLSYEVLAKQGIYMYHYSYVWPDQVNMKTRYYHDSVARERCIDGYYDRVYLPWVTGDEARRQAIEDEFDGVHDFLPSFRGACRTTPFTGQHPAAIAKRLDKLQALLESQL
jgi:hypothetical protein